MRKRIKIPFFIDKKCVFCENTFTTIEDSDETLCESCKEHFSYFLY